MGEEVLPIVDVPDLLYPGYVYVLMLEDDKLYVGYTKDAEVRISSHFLGRGAGWTKLHRPLGIKSIQPGDTQLENCLTLAPMCKYGWRNVRGGRYLDVNMTMAPPPIRTAYSLKPGVHVAKVEPEIMGEHAVVLQRLQEDDMATAWRARITGPQAAKACQQTGVKTLYAADEDALRVAVRRWLDVEEEPSFFPKCDEENV